MLEVFEISWAEEICGGRTCGGWFMRMGEEEAARSDLFGVLRKSRGGVVVGGGVWGSMFDMKTKVRCFLFLRLAAAMLGELGEAVGLVGMTMGGETEACLSHWLKGFLFPEGTRSAIVVGMDVEAEDARAQRRARVTDSLSDGHWT